MRRGLSINGRAAAADAILQFTVPIPASAFRRTSRRHLRALHPGRRIDHSPVWRHRTGASDLLPHLVVLMGGRSGWRAEKGAGSVFHFTALRAGRAREAAPHRNPVPNVGTGRRRPLRVLVVEDNPRQPAAWCPACSSDAGSQSPSLAEEWRRGPHYARAIRPGPDGRAHAGHGRFRSHGCYPQTGGGRQRAGRPSWL